MKKYIPLHFQVVQTKECDSKNFDKLYTMATRNKVLSFATYLTQWKIKQLLTWSLDEILQTKNFVFSRIENKVDHLFNSYCTFLDRLVDNSSFFFLMQSRILFNRAMQDIVKALKEKHSSSLPGISSRMLLIPVYNHILSSRFQLSKWKRWRGFIFENLLIWKSDSLRLIYVVKSVIWFYLFKYCYWFLTTKITFSNCISTIFTPSIMKTKKFSLSLFPMKISFVQRNMHLLFYIHPR